MTTTLIADTPVDVDAEGFLTDPAQWNEELARAIAAENGIDELSDRHWLVVRYMRDRYLQTGTAPSIGSLGRESGVPVKESTGSSRKGRPSSPPRSAASQPTGCIYRSTMTQLLEHPRTAPVEPKATEKVSIVISKGSLKGIYPGLIMADGARMEGIDADLFFTFFGLDASAEIATRRSSSRPWQPRNAPADVDRSDVRLVRARHLDVRAPGEDRDPADSGVHRARRRLGRAPLRLQGDRRHVRADDGRLRPAGQDVVASASSTRRPPAARSSSARGSEEPEHPLQTAEASAQRVVVQDLGGALTRA